MPPILSRLDSSDDDDESDTSNVLVAKFQVDPIQRQLLQLANASKNSIETKLGINDSSRIVLDIINLAKKAKSHRNECRYIADQAYLLVNAVDGGVKGRALDVNIILRDHIVRLNEDLGQIRRIIKGFTSWWILFRPAWSTSAAPRGLERCHDILHHGMDMYLLLLRCSLAQPANRRRVRKGRRFSTMSPLPPPPQPPPLPRSRRRTTYPYPALRPAPFPSTSTAPWPKQAHHTRTPLMATSFK